MKKLRAFVAIPMPADLRRKVTSLTGSLAKSITGVRWVETEGLHITLHFFGEIVELETVEISRCLQRIASQHTVFEIASQGLGAFPALDRPRTLWAGVSSGADPLMALQSELVDALSDLGYKAETRRYHPHLTLGRVRDKSGVSAINDSFSSRTDLLIGHAPVENIVFYSSEVRRTGSIYTPIATCPLAK